MGENKGHAKFYYDEKPFDILDLSSKEQILSSIKHDEYELKAFIQKIPLDEVTLDVGSGVGRVSIYLNLIGRNVIAIDYSLTSLRILRSYCSIPCIWADNLNLPLRNNSAQVIISTGVIHHTIDPYQSLRENCRVLKEKGQLYLRTYAHRSYYYYLYRYLGNVLRHICNRGNLGRFLVNRIMFTVFVLIRLIMRPRGTKQLDKLYIIYSNGFLKTGVSFLKREDIEKLLREEGLEISHYEKKGYMHLFIASKEGQKLMRMASTVSRIKGER